MILGLGMEANIWAYWVNLNQVPVMPVWKRIKQNREKSLLNLIWLVSICKDTGLIWKPNMRSQRPGTIYQRIKPRGQANWKLIFRFYLTITLFIHHSNQSSRASSCLDASQMKVNQHILRQSLRDDSYGAAHMSAEHGSKRFYFSTKKKGTLWNASRFISHRECLIYSAVWWWLGFSKVKPARHLSERDRCHRGPHAGFLLPLLNSLWTQRQRQTGFLLLL